MSDRDEYKLIEGTFSATEARELLGAMLKSKIDFHSLERHSLSEKSGDEARSLARLAELRTLDSELKARFEEVKGAGKKLRIFAKLEIEEVD